MINILSLNVTFENFNLSFVNTAQNIILRWKPETVKVNTLNSF